MRDRARRRRARRNEDFIEQYVFPAQIETHVRRREPNLDDREWKHVEQGLREWFVCCAWSEGALLGMPSRLVDEAWHQFILDSPAYTRFCEEAFGTYLHHNPEETMSTPLGDALDDTVRAWDRSSAGREGESVLWALDGLLGAEHPLGLSDQQVEQARSGDGERGGGGWAGNVFGGGGHHHHGSSEGEAGSAEAGTEGGGGDGAGDSAGGDSGGSGCGGGGCGGGGE